MGVHRAERAQRGEGGVGIGKEVGIDRVERMQQNLQWPPAVEDPQAGSTVSPRRAATPPRQR
jgi:hypothetical protein